MEEEKPTTLYFIRHGQTPSNALGVQQGNKIDDSLSPRGVEQIKSLAKVGQYLGLDVMFSSNLHRAEETAAIIDSKLNPPVTIFHEDRLRERDFGSLTGKNEAELNVLLPDHAEKEALQMYDYRPFGGENVEDVRQRAIAAILEIIEKYPNKNIGIVTHAGIIHLILFHFPDMPRIYHQHEHGEKEIANSDVYEWYVTEDRIKNLKSLLKNPIV